MRQILQGYLAAWLRLGFGLFPVHEGTWLHEQIAPTRGRVVVANDNLRPLRRLHVVPDALEDEFWRRKRKALLQEVGVAEIMLAPVSKLIGKTLKEIQFHSRFKATVLSIRRRGELLTEDLLDQPLDFGDALLVNAGWPDILQLREERRDFVVLTLPQEFDEIVPARQQASWSLVIIGAMVAAMITGLVPTVAAAMLAAVALVLTRCVKLASVYRNINWPAVVLIAKRTSVVPARCKSPWFE